MFKLEVIEYFSAKKKEEKILTLSVILRSLLEYGPKMAYFYKYRYLETKEFIYIV